MIDRQLLERFVVGRDPSAFRDLVTRHGPAVLRTCRAYLHDPHEAEDAMQATFLVLVRRAPSIRNPELLNRWLVGVARRVAARSRRRGVLRSERERRWAEMHPESRESREGPLLELRRVVREEMSQLPEVSRQSLTLCYFEGLTHEEAARRLGWPVGTVKVRLVRARKQLRERLDRRGVALSVAFLLFLIPRKASASASPALLGPTVDAMTMAVSGDLAALEARFPKAFDLSRFASRAGKDARWGATGLFLLALLLVSTSAMALAHRVRARNVEVAAAYSRLAKVLAADCR